MGAPAQKMGSLETMIGELLQEPFAVDTSMHSMNFEAAGKLLEEVSEEFVTNGSESQNAKLRTSYERCKELYISILMEAESRPGGLGDATLGEIATPAAAPKAKVAVAKKAKKAKPATHSEKSEAASKKEEKDSTASQEIKGPTDEKALEFWHAVKSFEGSPLPTSLALRFEAQCLAFALEVECRSRLASGIHNFWSKRGEAMLAVADMENGGRAKQEFMDALTELGAERPDWLEDGMLPEAALRGAIRFLSHAPSIESAYQPSLLETGLILILFGSDDPLRGWERTNLVGQRGLTGEDLIEIFFRLMRVQALRNRSLNSSLPIEAPHLEILKETVERAFALLDRIEVAEEAAKKVKKESA